jgi:hypothetical protein
VIFNPTDKKENIAIQLKDKTKNISISAKAIQTVVINP